MFHAEMEDTNDRPCDPIPNNFYSSFLESRHDHMEVKAIAYVIEKCRDSRVPCHIVHLSSANALPMIREARKEGLPLTVETCFHYLYFNAENIPHGKHGN